jgi:hypothetical protein
MSPDYIGHRHLCIKAGTQPKQQDRLVISSRDVLKLAQLITRKMSDRQSVYARVRNM